MKSIVLVCSTTLLSLVLMELLLRLFTPFPITASSNKVYHPKLLYVMNSGLPDIDRRGFRNPDDERDEPVYEIVTIGDSHTYGYNVVSAQTWPAQLASMLSRSVYNLGVGSYNIYQYIYLFEFALRFKPKYVIMGFYPANDLLFDVCVVLQLDYWQQRLVEEGLESSTCQAAGELEKRVSPAPVRLPLYKKSAIGSALSYLVLSPLRTLFRPPRHRPNEHNAYIFESGELRMALSRRLVEEHRHMTDLRRASVRQHFDNSLQLFRTIAKTAIDQDVKLAVLIVPSQERVLYHWAKSCDAEMQASLQSVVAHEIELTKKYVRFFQEIGVATADATHEMVKLLDRARHTGERLYPDMNAHPLESGYQAYAKTAMQFFN